jgi:hypothetical protein
MQLFRRPRKQGGAGVKGVSMAATQELSSLLNWEEHTNAWTEYGDAEGVFEGLCMAAGGRSLNIDEARRRYEEIDLELVWVSRIERGSEPASVFVEDDLVPVLEGIKRRWSGIHPASADGLRMMRGKTAELRALCFEAMNELFTCRPVQGYGL